MMLVPTTLMGMAFPLAARAYATARGGVSRPVGTIYAANTLGSISGVLPGRLRADPGDGDARHDPGRGGREHAVGLGLLGASASRGRLCGRLVAVASWLAVVAGGQGLSGWDATTLTFGPYWHARRGTLGGTKGLSARQAEQAARSMQILYHKEGAFDTITVRSLGNAPHPVHQRQTRRLQLARTCRPNCSWAICRCSCTAGLNACW